MSNIIKFNEENLVEEQNYEIYDMEKENNKNTLVPQIKNKMHEYRKILLKNNFLEPEIQNLSYEKWYFYKQVTSLTAFAVNFKRTNIGIEVVYGYASTAFILMKGNENSLKRLGLWDTDINLRETIFLTLDCDESEMFVHIQNMYDEYRHVEKNELLEIVKKKRKEFINKIAIRLKPLGFKKKGNTWKRTLEGKFYLMFEAQKATYSDEYYFNVIVNLENRKFARECFYDRIFPNKLCPLDWKLFPDNEFLSFLDNEVLNSLLHIMNTPLVNLGKDRMIWEGCTCERDECDVCWVEKNLWEVNKDDKHEK